MTLILSFGARDMYSYVSTSLAFGFNIRNIKEIRTCDIKGHEIAACIVLVERRCGKRKHINERNLNGVAPRARLIGCQH